VSVIIPCYNQAHYLGDALASVAAKTHGRPEVIVVDDGSTDNTVEVAERYPGVRYVRQDNAGLAAARNTGIRHSTGEYLFFLDFDDRLLPSAFRVGLTALAARPGHAFVYGGWRLIGADGTVMPTPEPAQVDDDPYRGLLRMCFISTPAAVMYRRAAVAAGGFDTAVSPSADYNLYLRLTRRWPVYCHGELVAEYRRHGANMTLDRAMMLQAELKVLRTQRPYVRRRHHPGALMPAGREWADAASDLSVRLRYSALLRAIRGGNDRGEGVRGRGAGFTRWSSSTATRWCGGPRTRLASASARTTAAPPWRASWPRSCEQAIGVAACRKSPRWLPTTLEVSPSLFKRSAGNDPTASYGDTPSKGDGIRKLARHAAPSRSMSRVGLIAMAEKVSCNQIPPAQLQRLPRTPQAWLGQAQASTAQ